MGKRFKKTEIDRIPKEWEVVELGQFAKVDSGDTAPQGKEFFEAGKYPFIRMQHLNDLEENKYVKHCDLINQRAVQHKKLKMVEKGSILLAKSGESIRTEKKALLKFSSYVVNHLAIITILLDADVDNEYLFYFFKKFRLSSLLTQTTTPSINLSVIKKIKIPLPPLPEQKKIAEILSTVDKAIEKVDEAIKKTERLKKGLMQELLTRGIGHKEFKDTDLSAVPGTAQAGIGRIPKEWRVVRLEEVISSFHNGIWGEEPIEQEKSYPVIRSTEIAHDGKIILSNVASRKIPDEKVGKYSLKDGDILLVSSSGSSHLIGRAALFKQFSENEVCLFSNFMLRLRPQNVDSVFLFYYFNSSLYYHFLKTLQQTSTGLRNLPKKEFVKFKLFLPSLPEQKKIAEILSSVDKRLDALRSKKQKFEAMKKGLMNDLLTGRKRVKLESKGSGGSGGSRGSEGSGESRESKGRGSQR